jgi:hypothetical protein
VATYQIKKNRKAIAILKIDDFLHENSLLTLLIGVWSVFAGLPPSDFMRVHTKAQFSGFRNPPHSKSICLYLCPLASDLFSLILHAYQRPITYLLFHCWVSRMRVMNIEKTSEDPGAEVVLVYNTVHLSDTGPLPTQYEGMVEKARHHSANRVFLLSVDM